MLYMFFEFPSLYSLAVEVKFMFNIISIRNAKKKEKNEKAQCEKHI